MNVLRKTARGIAIITGVKKRGEEIAIIGVKNGGQELASDNRIEIYPDLFSGFDIV